MLQTPKVAEHNRDRPSSASSVRTRVNRIHTNYNNLSACKVLHSKHVFSCVSLSVHFYMTVFLVEFVFIMADFHALNACNAAMAVACTVLVVKKHLWCTELTWSSYCKIFFCTQKTCDHLCVRRVGTRGSCANTASCLPSNSCGMCNQ